MDSVDYYNKYANVFFDSTVDLDMTEVLDRFLEFMESGDTVLDLGCGSGRDSKYMLDQGVEVTLLDASKELCALADIYTGIEPLCMDFRDIDFQNVFNGIWACSSLLHIPKKEMPEMLEKIYQALKPGGIFYMSVKEGDFEGFRKERFFADYSMKELKKLIKKNSQFELLDIWESNDIRSAREDEQWINVFLQKTQIEQ